MWPNSWIIGETCHQALLLQFDGCNTQDVRCLCKSNSFLGSIALCIKTHSLGATERDSAWDHFTYSVCEINNAVVSDVDYQSSIDYVNSTKVLDHFASDQVPVYQPVKVPFRKFRMAYMSVYNYLRMKDIGTWQGSFLVAYWVIIMILATMSKFLTYVYVRFSSRRACMDRPGKATRWLQKNLFIPACFGFKHMTRLNCFGMRFMIPTRFETIVIGVYFILNIIFMVTPYTFLDQDILYPSHYKEMLRFVSDRSGIIGVIQMPLFVLFSLRNNLLIWSTGWTYTTFNTYHRAIARVTYLQFIVHAVTKHVFSASYGASLVKYFYPLPYYRWGVAAMFLMAIMVGSGSFRVNYYEIFLRLHIACAIGAFVCTIYHLNGLGYKQTVYVSFALWCADWIIRLTRIIFINFSLILPPAMGSARTTFAQVCVVNKDLISVKIRTPIVWRAKPGQYVFIHLNRLRFWEAHPFSVVGPSSDGESFQLMCKQRNGMTRRFIKYLTKKNCAENNPMTISVVIEGPYGSHCPVENYDNVLLIAGGVGITGVMPYIEHLIDQERSIRIVFLWYVQFRHEAFWVGERLAKAYRTAKAEIFIHAMKDLGEHGLMEKEDSLDAAPTTVPQLKPTSVSSMTLSSQQSLNSNWSETDLARSTENLGKHGNWQDIINMGQRPDLKERIGNFFKQSGGSACVLGCGPPPMMDAIRAGVVETMDYCEHGRVDYFEEAYSW
ncbi:ferric reductase transmembrane component 3 [Trichomonascus vanleenenianus]|uniref:ferric reductase family protein n=1 Tax=Trichomonascus vanleenenianus TaxID=2268995 RepID=UPI003ECAC985